MAKKLQVTGPVMAMAPLCVQTTVEATGRDSGGKLQEVTEVEFRQDGNDVAELTSVFTKQKRAAALLTKADGRYRLTTLTTNLLESQASRG